MAQRRSGSFLPVKAHLETPSVARVYNYYLGGTTNWEVDRSFGDRVLDSFPLMRRIAFVHRLFLNRVVCHVMRRGIRQFLDVGSGVPSAGATHEVADNWAIHANRRPDARVVYVDNDPVAVGLGQMLLDSEGDRRRHAMIEADLRDPDDLWQQALETDLLDHDRPIGLLLVGLLHLEQRDLAGNELGPESVATLRELLPAGSHVGLSHVSDEGVSAGSHEALAGLKRVLDQSGSGSVTWRSRADIEKMLGDWRMVEPGWTAAIDWRPEDTGPHAPEIMLPAASNALIWAGVATKT